MFLKCAFQTNTYLKFELKSMKIEKCSELQALLSVFKSSTYSENLAHAVFNFAKAWGQGVSL